MRQQPLKNLTTYHFNITGCHKQQFGEQSPFCCLTAKTAPNSNDMITDKQTPDKPKKTAQKPRKQPKTDIFTSICKSDLKIEVVKEYKFHPTRKWRFDFAIPEHKIALEVEGGVWTGGRHTSSTGFLKDMEKYNTATSMGWRVFRTTPNDLYNSKTLNMLKNAILGCFSPENDTL